MRILKSAALAFSLGCMLTLTAEAMEIFVTDSGAYDETGSWSATGNEYIAGFCPDCGGQTYRNFFTFDVSGVGEVASATLRIANFSVASAGTYSLWDVTTEVGTLVSRGPGATSIYDDLGMGESFGSIGLLAGQPWGLIEIDLSAAAVASINAADGLWAIGGSYASTLYAFGFSDSSCRFCGGAPRFLIVELVPVPPAVWLFGSSLGLLGWMRRKRSV